MRDTIRKKGEINIFLFCLTLALWGCASDLSKGTLRLIYEVESFDREKGEMRVNFNVENNTSESLKGGNWELHWNQIRGFIDSKTLPDGVDFEWVNGEHYFVLSFGKEWSLNPGEKITIPVTQSGIMDRLAMGPVGAFIVNNKNAYDIETEIVWENAKGVDGLEIPSAEKRYTEYEGLYQLNKKDIEWVLPTPDKIKMSGKFRKKDTEWNLDLDKEFSMQKNDINTLLDSFFSLPVADTKNEANFFIKHDKGLSNESYKLSIENAEIFIYSSSYSGVVFALQSLRQIINISETEGSDWPIIKINDKPRYGHRGFMLDIARHFHDVGKIKEVLDIMSLFKLNYFDLRLTDDEGWRLEIPGLPELTSIGSNRGYSSNQKNTLIPAYGSGATGKVKGNGYLSKQDYISIIQYAKRLGIKVMPQISFPSHARAAIKAMEARHEKYMLNGNESAANEFYLSDPEDQSEYRSAQRYNDNVICICRESSYRFIEKVIDEVAAMYKEAGVDLERFSIGADELPYGVWTKSPKCDDFMSNKENAIKNLDQLYNHSLKRLKSIFDRNNIKMAAWEDILLNHSNKAQSETKIKQEKFDFDVIPYVWNNTWGDGREDMIYKFANLGFKTVMSNSSAFYFDMTDDKDMENYGLNWSGYVSYRDAWGTDPDNVFGNYSLNQKHNITKNYTANKEKLDSEGTKNFLGIQSQLWSETVRSNSILDELLLPNLIIFSERAWVSQPKWILENDPVQQEKKLLIEWNKFTNTIGQRTLHLLNYTFNNLKFDLPKPGAIIKNDTLSVRVQFPGSIVRYTTDGTTPNKNSVLYEKPIKIDTSKSMILRTFDNQGRGGRSIKIK